MVLIPGTRLGVYEVVSAIGAGGMGEVYRAHDTTLGRDVAIKVLPELFAADAERLARFDREARVLASLNHPNIAAIHGLEQSGSSACLVMELAIGEPLAARIARGAIALDEALPIAGQIAAALEAAHEKGIIHRDLKPANIVVAPDGKVKVLDFGLAKFSDSANTAGPASDLSMSPTLAHVGTLAGVILGTAAYMSPEQARGKIVDQRADIWAFGCVLFEMLAGRQTFAGETLTDIVAAVVKNDPDWRALPADTPRRLRDLLDRCLRKNPHDRLRDAADVRIAIEDAAKPEDRRAIHAPIRKTSVAVPVVAAVALTAIVSTAFWWTRARLSIEPPTPLHLSVQTIESAHAADSLDSNPKQISPNGKSIVYVADQDGTPRLYLQNIHQSSGRFIGGTDNPASPFFSPDGLWIGFGSGKTLKKVSVSGGVPVAICEVSTSGTYSGFVSGAWRRDNTIVFVPAFNAGIWVVSANGGKPELLLKTDEAKDRIAYMNLQVLPDDRGVLFSLASGRAITTDDQQIAILEPGASEPRVLPIRGVSQAAYVSSGHIAYSHRGAILAVPFDLSTLTVTGSPTSVIEGLGKSPLWDPGFSLSNAGTLVYESHGANAGAGFRLAAVDRRGNVRPITDDHAMPADFSLSPDGKQVAAEVLAVNNDIWIYDVADGTSTRLTFEPGDEVFPQWTPDGRRIAFGSRIGRMFWKSADGTGQREEFPRGEFPRFPSSFSPDGKTLAFVEAHPGTKNDIWLLPLEGDRRPQPFLNSDADEKAPKFSPNGRWLAYVSDETGRDEVWLRPMGSGGAKKRISSGGGGSPIWNRNGRELFYLKGDTLEAVALDSDMNRVGQEHVVLDAPKFENAQFQIDNPYYDVTPDGEHFVMVLTPKALHPTHFNIIVNWPEELKRLAPAK